MARKMERVFTTRVGQAVELIGASTRVQVWIDGKLYLSVAGLRKARRTALDYSRRRAAAD